MGIMSGVAGMLCMTFPITSGASFVWDMRWVPFILVGLYGGFRGGIICSSIMLIYRALLGGGFLAWFVVFADVIVLLPIVLKIGSVIENKPIRVRLICVSFVALASYLYIEISIFLYFVYLKKTGFFLHYGTSFFITFGVATVAGCVICLVLIETIFHQVEIQKKLEETERLHLVSELAASFAHEIRNPLTVAKGFVQLMGKSVDDKLRTYSTLATSELDRAEGIISDYLNFAKPQLKSQRVMDLGEILNDVVQMMTPYAAAHNAEISYKAEQRIFIYADVQQFKQIMMNVMKNAIESLIGSGNVILETMQEQHWVHISIRDNGVGMSEEQLSRLGKPFYSTKSKGTGLGMMTTFRLVQEMGGELHYESKIGTGTVASIQFPTPGA